MRRSVPWVAAVGSLLALVMTSPGNATEASLRCQQLAVAPDEATSGRLTCIEMTDDGGNPSQRTVVVHASGDHGRTWTVKRGLGLVAAGTATAQDPTNGGTYGTIGSSPDGLFYSAGYSQDHRLYYNQYKAGLMMSTDDGDTWVPIAPLFSSTQATSPVFTPYVDPRLAQPDQPATTLYPVAIGSVNDVWIRNNLNGQSTKIPYGSLRVDAPLDRPAVGTPDQEDGKYLFSRTQFGAYPGYNLGQVLGNGSQPFSLFSEATNTLYGCDYDLTCGAALHSWPAGTWASPTLAGDYERTGRMFAYTVDLSRMNLAGLTWAYPFDQVESTDAGRSWHRWAGIEALRSPSQKRGWDAAFGIVTDPARPKHVIAFGGDTCFSKDSCHKLQAAGPKAAHVGTFESTDSGRTFRRVAVDAQLAPIQGRVVDLQLAPSGALLALVGQDWNSNGGWIYGKPAQLWCTHDLGRHWTASHCWEP